MRTTFSRRGFGTAGLAALGGFLSSGDARAGAADETLATAGRAIGLDIGSAIRARPRQEVAALIARECSLVTPENALKPMQLATGEDRFHWAEADRIYAFAEANGLKVHGHTLFWYKQPLEWAISDARGKSLEKVVKVYADFAAQVVRHYPQTVSWDVLNEIAGTGQLFREVAPLSRFGLDFVEALLHSLRAQVPGAALVINENDLECGAQGCAAKRENVLRILTGLRARGTPLDAIGMQSHLSSRQPPNEDEVLSFIREAEALGLKVFISELDVNDTAFAADIGRRDEEVAQLYREYLDTALKSRAVKRVVFWGITDAENWIADGEAGARKDGLAQRPALFDRYLGKKPAYYQVLEALKGASAR